VPDVAADAAPATGYEIVVAGQSTVVGGTSGAAPLWAGLTAALGRKPGWINPALWSNPAAMTEITQGDNGQYRAGPYPNPCCGLGVPIGAALAKLKL
jgi:subtilase family serine protease